MLFLIISIIIFNAYAFFMSKRISAVEIYSAVLFSALFDILVDLYIDLKYELYHYFAPGPDWEFLLVAFGVFPAVCIIIYNYYPFHKKLVHKALYVLLWCLFAVGYEYTASKTGFYYYTGWNIFYSALSYPIIITVLILNLHFTRTLLRVFLEQKK